MRWISRLSIRGKVTLIAVSVSTVALLVSSVSFLAFDFSVSKTAVRNDLVTQAEIIGAASAAAIMFDDAAAATETLTSLAAKKEIVVAALYRPDGRLLAWHAPGLAIASVPPSAPSQPGASFAHGRLEVVHAIRLSERTVGTIYLQSDLSQWSERLWQGLRVVGLLFGASLILALTLASRLQGAISNPIRRLREGMSEVSNQRDYTVRVVRSSPDDIGALVDGFNEMIAEIASRDDALQDANRALVSLNATLEDRVAERSAAAEERSRLLAVSEQALRHQTQLLESILNSMGDGVIAMGDGDRVILSNDAALGLLGARPVLTDDTIRKLTFYQPDASTPYTADSLPLSRATRGESVDGAELLFRRDAQGEERWLSVNARPLRLEGSVSHGAVGVFRDITQQKRQEAALVTARDAAEAANRAKGTFLANMSHELRTPLNAIIGYSELLEEEARENGHEQYVDDLRNVHTSGRHLLSLISDVLDLSKIEAGRLDLSVEVFDVAPAMRDLVSSVATLVSRNGNVLVADIPESLGTMQSDPTRVRQILYNLIANAAKFTKQGRITVAAARRDLDGRSWIESTVSDTGIGMAPDVLRRLFTEFTQADPSTTRTYGGTGLGLAISRRLSQMLGGSIDVESTEGGGSTFRLLVPADLPITADGPPRPVVRPQPAAAPASQTGRTVLVIDDDPAARDLIASHIQRDGLTAVTAESGLEGLALARALRPAAITLDVLMPGMDGWAVLAALKADATLAAIPVVMVTITGDHKTGYALGASAFVEKPIHGASLNRLLRAHVDAIGGPPNQVRS